MELPLVASIVHLHHFIAEKHLKFHHLAATSPSSPDSPLPTSPKPSLRASRHCLNSTPNSARLSFSLITPPELVLIPVLARVILTVPEAFVLVSGQPHATLSALTVLQCPPLDFSPNNPQGGLIPMQGAALPLYHQSIEPMCKETTFECGVSNDL